MDERPPLPVRCSITDLPPEIILGILSTLADLESLLSTIQSCPAAVAAKLGSSVLKADASYLLIGGTGGLGRSIARLMSSKGARNIVLVPRSVSINHKIQDLIDELAAHVTAISVKPCDVSRMESVDNLISQELKGLPPVRGVVHGAMVLRDMLFENMTLDDFQAVASCKVEGAWNLHHVLHDTPLDFSVALSSVAGIIGNRGQAAYAAANVFLDGFKEYRRSEQSISPKA